MKTSKFLIALFFLTLPVMGLANEDVSAEIDATVWKLISRTVVENDIAEGRLVQPFELSVDMDFKYYLVCPAVAAQNPKVVAFRNWLVEEAKLMPEAA